MFKSIVVAPETEARSRDFEAWLSLRPGKAKDQMQPESVRKHVGNFRRLATAMGSRKWTYENVRTTVLDFTSESGESTKNQWNGTIRLLARFYRKARINAEFTHDNPDEPECQQDDCSCWPHVKVPKRSPNVKPPISRKTLETLVEYATRRGDDEFAVYLLTAWNTLGRAESDLLEDLRVRDFVFENPKYGEGEVIFRDGKTGTNQYGYFWYPGDAERVQDFLQGREPGEFAFKGRESTAKSLKHFYKGRLTYDTARQKFNRYILATKSPVHTIHNIRAGSAVHMDANGFARSTIMMFGRWESLGALERYLREEASVVRADLKRVARNIREVAPVITVTEPAKSVSPENPLMILKVRLAKGEITVADYRELAAMVVSA